MATTRTVTLENAIETAIGLNTPVAVAATPAEVAAYADGRGYETGWTEIRTADRDRPTVTVAWGWRDDTPDGEFDWVLVLES
jgi:hypothetical protein